MDIFCFSFFNFLQKVVIGVPGCDIVLCILIGLEKEGYRKIRRLPVCLGGKFINGLPFINGVLPNMFLREKRQSGINKIAFIKCKKKTDLKSY